MENRGAEPPVVVGEKEPAANLSAIDKWLALGLVVFSTALLLITAGNVGVTWDEPRYFVDSELYVQWFKVLGQSVGEGNIGYAFRGDVLDRYWDVLDEHPPLDKVFCGLVWEVTRPLLGDLIAHRFGNMIVFGFLVGLLYLMTSQVGGRVAGLAAAIALVSMPRVFFHAHLASLDIPVAFVWFVTVYVFWRTSGRRGWGWTILNGVVYGLAVATKVHAVFVLVVLFAWVLLFRRRRYLLWRVMAMPFVGFLTFIVVWPRMYHQIGAKLAWYYDYLRFATSRQVNRQYYFGKRYWGPPWHFPFVITLVVVPVTITLLYWLGITKAVRERSRSPTTWLFMFNALLPPTIFALGASHMWDNERMFMPTFPYLAALAGLGFGWLLEVITPWVERFIGPGRRLAVGAVLVLAVFVPPAVASARLHPHQLSYYNGLIGGLRGATRMGFETTYYCETYASVLPYINHRARLGAVVWSEEFSQDVLYYYQQHGQLRPDLRIASRRSAMSIYADRDIEWDHSRIWDADYALIQYRQSGFSRELRAFMSTFEPIYTLAFEEVPLISLYDRQHVAHPVGVRLGEGIELVGYDLHDDLTLRPEETVHLSLLWQTTVEQERDYTVFVQLLDESGRLRAQIDRYPMDGVRPTSSWLAGEKIRDDYQLVIPSDLPPGDYQLIAGMYALETMERLPVRDVQAVTLGDHVSLGEVTVIR